jgi:hypothetical protein
VLVLVLQMAVVQALPVRLLLLVGGWCRCCWWCNVLLVRLVVLLVVVQCATAADTAHSILHI